MLDADEASKLRELLSTGPATTAQIAIACKWDLRVAQRNLEALAEAGFIECSDRTSNFNTRRWRDIELDRFEPDPSPPPPPVKPRPVPISHETEAEQEASIGRDQPTALPENPYAAPREDSPPPPRSAPAASPPSDDEGSFWLGLVAGLIGGIVVVLLVLRRAKLKTRQGLYWGIAAQIVLYLLFKAFD